MRIAAILLLSMCFAATAEVYKSVDEDGNIIYSDSPAAGGRQLDLPAGNTIPMPEWQPPAGEEEPAFRYRVFRIVSPGPEQIIRSNTGDLTVVLRLVPQLATGHSINVSVDGRQMVSGSRDSEHSINGLTPGEHRITASVHDEQGREMKRSAPVRFFMRRRHNPASNSEVGPRDATGAPYRPGPSVRVWTPGPDIEHFLPGPVPTTGSSQ